MKPGKHQRSKQRCQDLCWKVYDRAQSFVLRSYTMHELRCYWLVPQYGVNNYCVLCRVKAKKANKKIQQRTLTSFSINYGFCHDHITKRSFFVCSTQRGCRVIELSTQCSPGIWDLTKIQCENREKAN